jgi:hypothetical protein
MMSPFGISNSLVVSSANSTGAGKFVAIRFHPHNWRLSQSHRRPSSEDGRFSLSFAAMAMVISPSAFLL